MQHSTKGATRPSKGARKRQARRAVQLASEILGGRGEEALNRRVLEGLYEIRRRGGNNLQNGVFPFVDEFIWDLGTTFGAHQAEAVRPTLETEAALAVAQATGNPAPSLVGEYRRVDEQQLREIRRLGRWS